MFAGHENMFAILIAGNEKEEEMGIFKDNVRNIQSVVADPQVMGIRSAIHYFNSTFHFLQIYILLIQLNNFDF